MSGFARTVRVSPYPSGERQSVALEILGLDGLSESVYRAMLANPDADLDELAGKLEASRADINQALKRLVELSLVAERSPGRIYAPINPDVALDALPVTHDNVLDAWREVYRSDPPKQVVESFNGGQ